jgi:hypothetical protein
MVHGELSRNVADMRMSVVSFASACILDLGRLMWEDQTLEIQSAIPVGNTGVQIPSNWNPDERRGNFEDYEFRVEPYSMVFKTPEQKLQELFQVLQQIAPLWPMFQASGATLDAEAIVDEIARLKNRPEFKRFITFATPAMELGGDQNTIRSPSVTSRETVRRNVPTGGTSATAQLGGLGGFMGQIGAAQQAQQGAPTPGIAAGASPMPPGIGPTAEESQQLMKALGG